MSHIGPMVSYISEIILYIGSPQLYLFYDIYIHGQPPVAINTFFKMCNPKLANINKNGIFTLIPIEHTHIRAKLKQVKIFEHLLHFLQISESVFYSLFVNLSSALIFKPNLLSSPSDQTLASFTQVFIFKFLELSKLFYAFRKEVSFFTRQLKSFSAASYLN